MDNEFAPTQVLLSCNRCCDRAGILERRLSYCYSFLFLSVRSASSFLFRSLFHRWKFLKAVQVIFSEQRVTHRMASVHHSLFFPFFFFHSQCSGALGTVPPQGHDQKQRVSLSYDSGIRRLMVVSKFSGIRLLNRGSSDGIFRDIFSSKDNPTK